MSVDQTGQNNRVAKIEYFFMGIFDFRPGTDVRNSITNDAYGTINYGRSRNGQEDLGADNHVKKNRAKIYEKLSDGSDLPLRRDKQIGFPAP